MNKIITSIAALGIATVGFAGAASAQDAMVDGTVGATVDFPEVLSFASVDLDLSGDISLEEIHEVDPEFSEDLYAQADIDGSGALTETEYNVLLEADVLSAAEVG